MFVVEDVERHFSAIGGDVRHADLFFVNTACRYNVKYINFLPTLGIWVEVGMSRLTTCGSLYANRTVPFNKNELTCPLF